MKLNGREIPDCTIEDKWNLEENYEDYYYDDDNKDNDDNFLDKLFLLAALEEEGSL